VPMSKPTMSSGLLRFISFRSFGSVIRY